jgi:hypothetical protein
MEAYPEPQASKQSRRLGIPQQECKPNAAIRFSMPKKLNHGPWVAPRNRDPLET